ncbi:uncharacterized protein PHA67_005778 isoform 2-T2 [Liasis olivaceus]
MAAKAFATMKEDSDLLETFLLDEDYREHKLVCRSSYQKKPRGLPLLNSAVLLHNIKSGIKYNVSYFSRKCTMTGPPLKRSTLVLILVPSILLTIGGMWVWHNLPIAVADPKNLTVATLLEAKKSEPLCGAMEKCLDKAIKEFILELDIVKENAKMILECNGTRKEFVSGKGENYIEVFWVDGQTYYTVKEANLKVHMARLGRQPLPLSLASILNVYQELASHEGLDDLRQCLNKTIEEFPKEPSDVQNNAKLVVSCGENNVIFRSAAGKNEITVYKDMHGKIEFNVKYTGWAWWARLFTRRHVK